MVLLISTLYQSAVKDAPFSHGVIPRRLEHEPRRPGVSSFRLQVRIALLVVPGKVETRRRESRGRGCIRPTIEIVRARRRSSRPQIRYVLFAPAAVWPPATLLNSSRGIRIRIAPPAPYGEFESGPHGSPKVPPAPNTCCRFRYSSPRFGARVAQVEARRGSAVRRHSMLALAFQVNVLLVLE